MLAVLEARFAIMIALEQLALKQYSQQRKLATILMMIVEDLLMREYIKLAEQARLENALWEQQLARRASLSAAALYSQYQKLAI